jgi:hypothetical protein
VKSTEIANSFAFRNNARFTAPFLHSILLVRTIWFSLTTHACFAASSMASAVFAFRNDAKEISTTPADAAYSRRRRTLPFSPSGPLS